MKYLDVKCVQNLIYIIICHYILKGLLLCSRVYFYKSDKNWGLLHKFTDIEIDQGISILLIIAKNPRYFRIFIIHVNLELI